MKRNVKKLTSRIISTVMALTLIIALLPAAFAEDTATTDVTPLIFPFFHSQIHPDVDDDGVGDYVGHGLDYNNTVPENITYESGNKNVAFYTGNFTSTDWNASTSKIVMKSGIENPFIAFKLSGIPAGVNNLTFSWKRSDNGCVADIYLVPFTEPEQESNATTYALSLIENALPLMDELDFSVAGDAIEWEETVTDSYCRTVKFDAKTSDEYLFVIKKTGTGTWFSVDEEGTTTKSNGRMSYPVALLLDPIETVNYGVFTSDTSCADDISVTVDGTAGNTTGELYEGSTLTATAEDEADGFTFRYWVLGSAATGRYYSSEKSVTVNPYANIALTAIYTEDNDDAKVVDLFNYNGEFLQTLTDLSGLGDVKPTMIGHTFAGKWLIDENTELTSETILTAPVTQAVAQYTKNATYEAKNENNGSTYGWLRNGNLVTYDEDYTFLTWLNETNSITMNEKEVTHKAPLAVLEEYNGAYMLEYDEGDYTIEEAGILFGSSAEVDVKSAYSKAKVKDIKAHGQFTVAPMEDGTENMQTCARGYVIYKDVNENIKIVYTDATGNNAQ